MALHGQPLVFKTSRLFQQAKFQEILEGLSALGAGISDDVAKGFAIQLPNNWIFGGLQGRSWKEKRS